LWENHHLLEEIINLLTDCEEIISEKKIFKMLLVAIERGEGFVLNSLFNAVTYKNGYMPYIR